MKLTINNFEPIKHCELELNRFMILDGPQASGKSTIAKLIYFFRTIKNDLTDENSLRDKFNRMFGLHNDFKISFEYSVDCKIEITNQKIIVSENPKLNEDKNIIYIPASRSILSLLPILNEEQFDSLDYFSNSFLKEFQLTKDFRPNDESAQLKRFLPLIANQEIKFNYHSSGQQHLICILNLLMYHIENNNPTCFIIEEPEAHLYPNTQKEIAELIVIALRESNECIVTTHSPYILGALNNVLYARRLIDRGFDISSLSEDIPLIENVNELSAYYIDEGTIQNAIDEETGLIQNELIDGASDKINQLADELYELERGD